ncbi:Transcription-repair-coupling factor [compost metagenome]
MIGMGYERVERIENRGELSVRGGIIDFYPMTSPLAYRVELFDDEVDSIRTFDPADQRSIDKVRGVKITPAKEIIAERSRLESAASAAADMLERQLEKMTDRQAKLRLREEMGRELEMLREGNYFPEIYKYISLLYPERTALPCQRAGSR